MSKVKNLKSGVSVLDVRTAAPLPTALPFNDRRRGTITQQGYGWAWQQLRLRILKRDGYRCRCNECAELKRILPASEVDHHVPKAQGGSDDPSNLRAINRECHKAKTARDSRGETYRHLRADDRV